MRAWMVVTVIGSVLAMSGSRAGGDVLTALDVREVQAGGEIGRRIGVTVENNLLALDADGDFLAPFEKRTARGGYVGLEW